MNAFERRSEIVERMRVRKFDTAYNLAADFGVSQCTIFRDIQELSVGGYPIQAEPGRGGGIRWIGGKRGFPFSERETQALHNAVLLASPEDKPVLENLMRDRTKPGAETADYFGIFAGGKSQRALAAELGVSESHLSRVLSGQKRPGADLAERLLRIQGGGSSESD